jgi:hypothetical protein
MGSVLSGILGTQNDFQANTGGQNYGANIAAQQAALGNVQGQQQNLAQALQQQAAGVGANPAQAMLNQATNRNIKQSTGMIASQKSINPALVQRLAAQNAAQAGQEAAGQGALMQAQQSQNALGQMGGLYGQMAGQNLAAMGQSQNALSNQNAVNAGVAQGNQAAAGNIVGGLLGGAGAMMGMGASGGAGALGKLGAGIGGTRGAGGQYAMMSDGGEVDGTPQFHGDSPANDTVPTMLSPGEIVVPRSKASNPKLAKEFIDHVMNKGGEVKEDGEVTYADVLAAQKQLQTMIASLKGKK